MINRGTDDELVDLGVPYYFMDQNLGALVLVLMNHKGMAAQNWNTNGPWTIHFGGDDMFDPYTHMEVSNSWRYRGTPNHPVIELGIPIFRSLWGCSYLKIALLCRPELVGLHWCLHQGEWMRSRRLGICEAEGPNQCDLHAERKGKDPWSSAWVNDLEKKRITLHGVWNGFRNLALSCWELYQELWNTFGKISSASRIVSLRLTALWGWVVL